jgi:DNA topoisomerase I
MMATMVTRLRRSDCTGPGIHRRRRGRGFSYQWADGGAVDDPETVDRIRRLVIPPAWTDVWICPYVNGHIQAVGTDAAGRRQYLYHLRWRERRDAEKYQRVCRLADRLPRMRRRVRADLRTRGLNRRRVLATATRLLDLGFFRIGTDEYADENGSYGLTTVLREHVRVEPDGTVTFEYISKGGSERYHQLAEPEVAKVVRQLLRRRHPGPELLAYWDGRAWTDVSGADVNDYLKHAFGADVSAKDFRTWHATVLAAVGLAVSVGADTPPRRRRAVARVMREVSDYLGNTPAVTRASYVDPRVVDRFLAGETIADALAGLGATTRPGHLATEGGAERAVASLLSPGS